MINGLTFAHGSNSVDLLPGGGIQNTNGATLTLNDCYFSDNNVISSGGIIDFGYGGGVAQFLSGQLNINRCTFADNTAGTGGGGLGNVGGTVIVTNSTFTRNSAPNGGAISSSSILDLHSSTVVGNQATLGGMGGGVAQVADMFTVTNSVIAGNTSTGTAPNVSGTFVSEGSNVIGDAAGATGFTDGANGDQVGVADPKVGVFGNHGGLTDTLPLLAGSVAINQANATTAPERDQRGYVREDAADVGAFEFGGTIPVTLANISTRLSVGTGDNVLIGGFIVTGTEAKKVILRAIGPSLPLPGKLANPTLELYDASGLLVSNDDWKATQQEEIEVTNLQPPNDLESAIVATLPANAAYTAIVRGANSTTGVGLIEVVRSRSHGRFQAGEYFHPRLGANRRQRHDRWADCCGSRPAKSHRARDWPFASVVGKAGLIRRWNCTTATARSWSSTTIGEATRRPKSPRLAFPLRTTQNRPLSGR